ncbi:MAG: DUF4331 family protein [Deltaproteobacteria bacterium]|nr:DUF4331 family protein [Nannocystaceae bacterium]
MGHHFDSPEARADSRINISDNYLFHSPTDPTRVVAVMCVSPLAGLPSPYHGKPQWQTFRPTSAYELRFDTDGDLVADKVLRFVFDGDAAPQQFVAYWLEAADLRDEHARGTQVAQGQVESTVPLALGAGARVWIGAAGDPFWLDAVAAKVFLDAALATTPAPIESFSHSQITTAATNVIAIVVELPIAVLGNSRWNFYTAVGADDHGHYHQVARCGRPNFAATFVDHPERSRRMNETHPADDLAEFTPDVVKVVEVVAAQVGHVGDPSAYAQRVANWLLPDVIPFDPAQPSGFDFAGINGRRLDDDFGAVVYSAVFGRPMSTALPRLTDLRDDWPWVPVARPLPQGPGIAVPDRAG